MTHDHLKIAEYEGVMEIALADEKNLNCLSDDLCTEFLSQLRVAESDKGIRTVVITGRGKLFCSGGDLKAFINIDESLDSRVGRMLRDVHNPMVMFIRSMSTPVIAKVNGPAFGAGLTLALCADIVYAAESAFFTLPFVEKLAAVPDMGTSWLLSRILGPARALALALTGEKISAGEAERMGLIWKSVPNEDLAPTVKAIAIRLARMPAQAVARTKYEMKLALFNSFEDQIELERQLQIAGFSGKEVAEAFAAVLERREPDFTKV